MDFENFRPVTAKLDSDRHRSWRPHGNRHSSLELILAVKASAAAAAAGGVREAVCRIPEGSGVSPTGQQFRAYISADHQLSTRDGSREVSIRQASAGFLKEVFTKANRLHVVTEELKVHPGDVERINELNSLETWFVDAFQGIDAAFTPDLKLYDDPGRMSRA